MEGEGLRSLQGIAVPVVWADTQNTSRIRTTKNMPAPSIWCYSQGAGERRCLLWDLKECFHLSSRTAGPWGGKSFIKALMYWLHCICVSLHRDSPRLGTARRRSVPGYLCGDCLKAAAKRQNIFASYLSDMHSSDVWASPGWSTAAPAACQSVVTLVSKAASHSAETTVVRCRTCLFREIISVSVTYISSLCTRANFSLN